MINTSLKAEKLFPILQKALIRRPPSKQVCYGRNLPDISSIGLQCAFSSPTGYSTLIWHPNSIDIAQELPPVTLACSLGINFEGIELILHKYSSTPTICWKFGTAFRTYQDPFISDDVCCYSQSRINFLVEFHYLVRLSPYSVHLLFFL